MVRGRSEFGVFARQVIYPSRIPWKGRFSHFIPDKERKTDVVYEQVSPAAGLRRIAHCDGFFVHWFRERFCW